MALIHLKDQFLLLVLINLIILKVQFHLSFLMVLKVLIHLMDLIHLKVQYHLWDLYHLLVLYLPLFLVVQ